MEIKVTGRMTYKVQLSKDDLKKVEGFLRKLEPGDTTIELHAKELITMTVRALHENGEIKIPKPQAVKEFELTSIGVNREEAKGFFSNYGKGGMGQE